MAGAHDQFTTGQIVTAPGPIVTQDGRASAGSVGKVLELLPDAVVVAFPHRTLTVSFGSVVPVPR